MIRCFGPLVALWTMQFESKCSFFKQIVNHMSCLKNIPLTLALNVSTVPVDVLKEEVAHAIRSKYPNTSEVHLAKNASSGGIAYSKGMIVAYGSASGLPEFAEIVQT